MKRFWEKVQTARDGECWTWKGGGNEKGYGLFYFNGRTKGAHRVSWILTNGEIPNGMQVLHRCDNPSCVNPSHLFLGTAKDNTADAIAKGRYPQITAPGINRARGERNGQCKLTADEVKSIREISGTRAQLAIKFNVSESTIGNIKRRRKWAHI